MHLVLLLVMVGILAGCNHKTLTCRSEYLDPLYLASEQVDAPDPCRYCYYGQQIIVHWNIPKASFNQSVELLLHVRYGTREVETVKTTIHSPTGFWTYRLINEAYWCREGIVSFQAQLCQEGRLFDQWTHHLWSELIEIDYSSLD